MDIRKSERGVAVIVAVALAVALLMLSVALLGTTRRHTDTSKSYRQTDMLKMALLSVKADAVYRLNDDGGDLTQGMNSSDPHARANVGQYLYDPDGFGGFVTPAAFADAGNEVSGFRPDAADFYKNSTGNYLDQKMNPTTAEQSIYELKTRAYVVPLNAAFLVETVKKYYESENEKTREPVYPFPGLFDGENALAKNMVNVYTDTYGVFPFKHTDTASQSTSDKWPTGADAKIINAHNEFALDDFVTPSDYNDAKWQNAGKDNNGKTLASARFAALIAGVSDTVALYEGNNPDFTLGGEELSKKVYDNLGDLFTQTATVNTDNVKKIYDLPKAVMNYKFGYDMQKYNDDAIGYSDAGITDYLTSSSANAVKNRDQFISFNELGVNFSLLEKNSNQYAVFTGSMPYKTMAHEDPRLIGRTIKATLSENNAYGARVIEGNYPQAVIDALKNGTLTSDLAKDNGVDFLEFSANGSLRTATINSQSERHPIKLALNADTPQWLITAAVGWQLTNGSSPAVQAKRAASTETDYDGGAIYRKDYASLEEPTYVFDHRRIFANAAETSDTGELIITPFSYQAKKSGEESFARGKANYYLFPLQYAGKISATGCTVTWNGWEPTTHLDLLAFADDTTNSYVVNGDSPFKKGDGGVQKYTDVRTQTFAGTGTYVRPVVQAEYNGERPTDIFFAGRLAIYGNTLRAHGELARIAAIIDQNKEKTDARTAIGNQEYTGAIAKIINEIYTDPEIGYAPKATPTTRPTLARDPNEATKIYAQATDRSGSNVGMLIGQTKNNIDSGAVKDGLSFKLESGFAFLSTSGGGATGDRYIETLMEGSAAPVVTPGTNWGDAYKKYIVNNVARDWDGTVFWAGPEKNEQYNAIANTSPRYPAVPTLHFDRKITYANENIFQDGYFNTNPGVYPTNDKLFVNANLGSVGSNVQGMDDKLSSSSKGNNYYAEPVWYRDNLVYLPDSAKATAVKNSTEITGQGAVESGHVFYCDDSANGQKYISGKIYMLTAPPYLHNSGRWDKRSANVGEEADDAPGYRTTADTLRFAEANGSIDPSKQGTLYRKTYASPQTVGSKKYIGETSFWRYNWGKWIEIPESNRKKGAIMTFVTDSAGNRLVVEPGDTLAATYTRGEEAYLYGIVDADGKVTKTFYGPTKARDTYSTVLKATTTRLINSRAKGTTPANISAADILSNDATNFSAAFVGNFVMRPAYVHRWKPAIGTTFPMFTEVNPQAIKNAAIERVVLSLFGAHPIDNDGKVIPAFGSDYLYKLGNDGKKPASEIERLTFLKHEGDVVQPIFFSGTPDRFYRVIVAAGLIHTGKQEVVAKKFLQFVYRKNNGTGGAVVDNHLIDPE
ncbi:hypothetical protein FACS1894139_02090 [Planctomycetales bacterium]|nr:hypothetical protein FACS1894108_01150 [Planctomycetales bacterium]GHT02943.1 hypothetical protein FACS1894139_02090 [Planctomycetales bacterium]